MSAVDARRRREDTPDTAADFARLATLPAGPEREELSEKLVTASIRTIRQQLHVAIEPNGAGRKCIMSSNDIRVVIRKLASGEYKSVEDASRQLRTAYPNEVTPSAYTIRRELQRRHYKAIKKPHVLPLTRSRRNARFRFAEAYRSWTVEDWKRVVFSDETKVNRLGSDGLHWTWIDPDGKLRQRNVIHTYKHGGGSVMIWGCFC